MLATIVSSSAARVGKCDTARTRIEGKVQTMATSRPEAR
jgi:hypothetical protein